MRLRAYALAALALLAGAFSCEEESEPASDAGDDLCAQISARLRGCGLLSEGEMNCGFIELPGYGECVRPCFEVASCEDFRAQACDDVDNDLGLCIDRCLYEAAATDCGDGTRVDPDDRCDDVNDCANGADEQNCGVPADVDAPFDCGNGQQVFVHDQCDGNMDCSNGRDEAGCPMRARTICPGEEF